MAIKKSPFKRQKGELSDSQRLAIVYAHKAGVSQTKLAFDFSCSRKTIHNTIKRFTNHDTVESLPRSGRPKKFSDKTRHFIYLLARRHPN
jgi:transposase